jgi:hypothetical protein
MENYDLQQNQNIFNLKFYHLFIFPISWLIFAIIGRVFFENGLGKYHSTHSKRWATLCKSLFLLTFVTCCTLLELVTFEILDLLHPALRLFSWTTSLAILALLLNILIPGVLAISIGFHINLSFKKSLFLGIISVCLFQLLMWITESLLHFYKFKNGSGIDSGMVNINNIPSNPSILKWFFLFDMENTNFNGIIKKLAVILDFVLRFNIQQSITNIAILGTIFAAIISGNIHVYI